MALADFSWCEAFRQAGDDLERERIAGEQPVNSRQALSRGDDAFGTRRLRLVARGTKIRQIVAADEHLYFTPGPTPLVVAGVIALP